MRRAIVPSGLKKMPESQTARHDSQESMSVLKQKMDSPAVSPMPLRISVGAPITQGAMHDRPDDVGAMGGASLISLTFHGHRRTRYAAPEGRCMIAQTMKRPWEAFRSRH